MYFLCCSMYCLFSVVLCIVCVYMCTVLLPPGGYPIAVKYIISARHNSGPYFSVGSVNQHTYLTQLRDWLVRRLERISLNGKVWFLQDHLLTAPNRLVHHRDVLREEWRGCGSVTQLITAAMSYKKSRHAAL